MSATLNIHSAADYPAAALSNLAAHAFVFDGVPCASMEGLLQSFKTPDPAQQRALAALSGAAAQEAGQVYNESWQAEQMLHWQGRPYARLSGNYQSLLDRAYHALFTASAEFRAALDATGDAQLVHTSGSADESQTVLTQAEFCERLTNLRERLRED